MLFAQTIVSKIPKGEINMNLVKKSIGLMLVFFFTIICFAPTFAEDYAGNSCSKPSESLAVLEARLQSVKDALTTTGKSNDEKVKHEALTLAIKALKGISMPKKCKPLLVNTIDSLDSARLNVEYFEWEKEGDLYFYQGYHGFIMLCQVLIGKDLK